MNSIIAVNKLRSDLIFANQRAYSSRIYFSPFNIITTAIILSFFSFTENALAICSPDAVTGGTTVCDTSGVQTTTVGTGPNINDFTLKIDPSAIISTGDQGAINLGSGNTIQIGDNATVENEISTEELFFGQTIKVVNDNTITVGQGAKVLALGLINHSPMDIVGTGNTIINYGLIEATNAAPLIFEAQTGSNTLDNYGTIRSINFHSYLLYSRGTNITLINRSGAELDGSIYFNNGMNTITLEQNSIFTGYLLASGGSNTLNLEGSAGPSNSSDALTGEITDFQVITKNGGGQWALTGGINNTTTGLPSVVTINAGTLALGGVNLYTGETLINGGTLAALSDNAFSSSSSYNIASAATMDLQGHSQTIASVNNAGTINFNGTAGATLTITGNYAGNNAFINFNTQLGNDRSLTDKLLVGGSTSGNTSVVVNNAGGGGASTVDGIELIQVDGASNGEFTQWNRIVAGEYDYTLGRGAGADSGNWYLYSTQSPPGSDTSPQARVERPEAASYITNLAAANNMFVISREARLQNSYSANGLTDADNEHNLWMINEGGQNRSRDDSGQLRTQSNRYVLMLGGDFLQLSHNSLDSFHLGATAGYGTVNSDSDSSITGFNSKSSINGYNVGLYGTWYADEATKTGLYVDSWAQYSWFDNQINGHNIPEEDYQSKGVTTSLESGYTFRMGENAAKNTAYFIQPQAQLIWMDVRADDHTELNGTHVSGDGDGNIQTRLGVKAFIDGYSTQDRGKNRRFRPFVEATWIHNTNDFGATMDGETAKQAGAANIGELKLGVEGQIDKQFDLWGNVAQQVGNSGYSDIGGMVGMRYNF